MRKFAIATDHSGRLRTIDVRIYPTVRHMVRAAKRDAKYTGREASFKGAIGVTACYEFQRLEGDQWVSGSEAGQIFLVEGHLDPDIVAHEAVHMATGIYERDTFEGGYNEKLFPDMSREEVFCYLVSDITRKILERV